MHSIATATPYSKVSNILCFAHIPRPRCARAQSGERSRTGSFEARDSLTKRPSLASTDPCGYQRVLRCHHDDIDQLWRCREIRRRSIITSAHGDALARPSTIGGDALAAAGSYAASRPRCLTYPAPYYTTVQLLLRVAVSIVRR